MNKLILAITVSLLSLSASANVYLRSCSNFGDGVSYSYVSCINSNFSQVSRKLDNLYLSNCQNYGSTVSYSFTSCIDRNLSYVTRELDLFTPFCSNYGDTLSFSYQSCVNNVFFQIENALNRK